MESEIIHIITDPDLFILKPDPKARPVIKEAIINPVSRYM